MKRAAVFTAFAMSLLFSPSSHGMEPNEGKVRLLSVSISHLRTLYDYDLPHECLAGFLLKAREDIKNCDSNEFMQFLAQRNVEITKEPIKDESKEDTSAQEIKAEAPLNRILNTVNHVQPALHQSGCSPED